MAKGSPSMIALLGLLAVAGYQNRDKLGEMLKSKSGDDTGQPRYGASGQSENEAGLLDSFRQMAGGVGGAGGGLMGGLSELFERFSNPQHQAKAQSWVSTGRNETIEPDELEQVLDDETIAELSEKTGLSRSELLARLSQTLPDAVDQATPGGQFPALSAPEPRAI